MNREIKFRAWLKNENKMVDVKSLELDIQEITYIEIKGNEINLVAYEPFKYIELMQNIGQVDKNGVEIFEGDIVKRTYNNGEYIEIGFVKYDDLSFEFRFQGFDYDLDIHCGRLEVIGNIYEHKELLENE